MRAIVRNLGLVGALFVSQACLTEGRRPAGDTTGPDTTPPDTSVGETADSDASDGEPDGDSADDGVVSSDGNEGEVIEPACVSDQECLTLHAATPCSTWICVTPVCVQQPIEADCDDGNACTEGDFCDGIACGSGNNVDCTELAPDCWAGDGFECNPLSGCPGTARAVGTACMDGEGPTAGVCLDGWRIPNDVCDGAGRCLDTSFLVPSEIHPLAGDWHAVISTAPADDSHQTLRANLRFLQGGGLETMDVRATDEVWQLRFAGLGTPPDVGSYCAELGGTTDVVAGGDEFLAFTDATRSLMVLADDGGAALGVAVRPTGLPEDVTGTYHLVSTARFGSLSDRGLMTWQGTMQFSQGCIAAPGSLSTTAGLGSSYVFGTDKQYCFFEEAGLWRVELTLDDHVNPPFPITWFGAISAGGDVLLMTRDDGGLRYGTVLLVRQDADVGGAAMLGDWGFASQRGGISDVNQATSLTRFEHGWFELDESFRQFSGSIYGPEVDTPIMGAWWLTSTGGRYTQRAAFGSELVYHTGFIAPLSDFLFAWVAFPPEATPDSPQVLRVTPREGSLFVAVRLQPFETIDFLPGGVSPGAPGGDR